ncbi:FAD-binding oxidoreductase [Bradyrhizobium sp. AUGA SZCCT0274]|uniref:FAD-dependent oxidoreductase n=1 Tax=Bradyrhizobium sp. AUGA SZCCT0274 TaxID=2807670 RepID=UPI001BAB7098|nr:FAD-binding oxidoreductase [Bradyrhizobium sp. AUGA SZCCT0274]MBR1239082.1 FAD-binding oxidoreductase [Bradyrhizobium sp. AUGA SZCCT0274]
MRKFSQKFKTGASVAAVVVVLLGVYGYRKLQALAADPSGEKDCGPAVGGGDQAKIDLERIKAIAPLKDVKWSQLGGSINDASCLNKTEIYGVVEVRSVDDIAKTLTFARDNKLSVTTAGVRHSMGGQAFRKGGIVLDMRGFNKIVLNENRRSITVQPGATWHDIQNLLHPRFAVRAMQSTDIFSVGGSISVNAHGMDHQAGALRKSIKSMRVMLADGSLRTVSETDNKELFNLVVGGYGLFGVIVEAELDIADNLVYQTGRRIMDYKEFPGLFAREIEKDANIGLMYGHLSTAPSSFLQELLLYTYTKVDGSDFKREPLGEVSGTKLRRLTINLSKQGPLFQEMKWLSEKHIEHRMETCTVTRAQAIGSAEACLVNRNDPMHDSVPYLRNALPNDTDILHEYFIPRSQFVSFVDGMRKVLTDNKTNLLNASVRIVHQEDNFLTYSPEPAFSLVLYINQTTDDEGNKRMKKATEELIDLTITHKGRFFLPYQLYYSKDQLQRSYPEINDFFAAKKKYDPTELFTNTFYQKYAS